MELSSICMVLHGHGDEDGIVEIVISQSHGILRQSFLRMRHSSSIKNKIKRNKCSNLHQ